MSVYIVRTLKEALNTYTHVHLNVDKNRRIDKTGLHSFKIVGRMVRLTDTF